MLLPLPTQFNDEAALAFACILADYAETPDVTLDFRSIQFVLPYGTLVIAHAIKHFTAKRRVHGLKTFVKLDSSNAISYLRYFGFFRYINMVSEEERTEAPGGARYLPVKVINLSTLIPQAEAGHFQDSIETTSDQLARVIVPRAADQSAVDMISYSFRELIRNSFEHAEVSTCAVMAQRWDNGIAEVAIADRGIGVFRALSRKHAMNDADGAVRHCLKPGISSGTDRHTGSQWDNTGFGLYVVSALGQRYGSFAMLSSERFINPARPDQHDQPLRTVPLPGTLVKLRVRTGQAESWADVLRDIVAAGEAEARVTPGAVVSASAASKKSNTWDG